MAQWCSRAEAWFVPKSRLFPFCFFSSRCFTVVARARSVGACVCVCVCALECIKKWCGRRRQRRPPPPPLLRSLTQKRCLFWWSIYEFERTNYISYFTHTQKKIIRPTTTKHTHTHTHTHTRTHTYTHKSNKDCLQFSRVNVRIRFRRTKTVGNRLRAAAATKWLCLKHSF